MELLDERKFIIFDVETTGLSPVGGDRMIEIAALKIEDLKPVKRFHSLIDPQREISMEAFMVNGISQEMLTGAPQAHQVLPEFLKFIDGACLVGHNVKFDLGFLRYELGSLDLRLKEETEIFDTLKMSRRLLPDLGSHRLAFVARSLGIDNRQEHRAMSDVELTFSVFLKLLKIAEQNDVTDIKVFTP